MADTDIPKFKNYADGEPIPPVDPEDRRRRWKIPIPWTREALEAAWAQPQDASWGERYFHMSDPDGHELSFALPI